MYFWEMSVCIHSAIEIQRKIFSLSFCSAKECEGEKYYGKRHRGHQNEITER